MPNPPKKAELVTLFYCLRNINRPLLSDYSSPCDFCSEEVEDRMNWWMVRG